MVGAYLWHKGSASKYETPMAEAEVIRKTLRQTGDASRS
jgi:hypothetical protein